jgi:hypothetical protein
MAKDNAQLWTETANRGEEFHWPVRGDHARFIFLFYAPLIPFFVAICVEAEIELDHKNSVSNKDVT